MIDLGQALNLTAVEAEQLRRASHAALARQSYGDYCTFIDPSYTRPAHIRLLHEHLEMVERGDIRRLAITFPPQHGKSEAATGKFPAWCIGRDPLRKIMIVCHGATLAETFSGQNRDTIADAPNWPLVFPNVVLSPKKRGVEIWAVNQMRESLIASGIQGGITGYGAWLIILDDPIKTEEQASSQLYRDKVWMEYLKSARTRLTPDGRIIYIATRWHEDDMWNRFMEGPEADMWTFLHLPAISYGSPEDYRREDQTELEYKRETESIPKTAFPDPLGRPKGGILWPERYPESFYINQRLVLQHEFETMYQGNPSAPAGERFKRDWIRGITDEILSHLSPVAEARRRSYDLAWSERETADFTVGLKATLYTVKKPEKIEDEILRFYLSTLNLPPVILLLEAVDRWQKEWTESSDDIIKLAVDDSILYELIIETVAAQHVTFRSIVKDPRLWRHIVHPHKVDGDLEVRAKAALRLAGRGMVFIKYPSLLTPPSWEKDFLDELGKWPNGKKDDQVSAFAQLVNNLQPIIDRLLNDKNQNVMVTPFTHKAVDIMRLPTPFRNFFRGISSPVDQRAWFKD